MENKSHVKVSVTRHFNASAERVFDAWLDPVKAGQWLFSTPSGEMIRVEIDARVGGSFIFVDRREGEEIAHVGDYLEIDRPRRLVFTFAVPKYSSESTRVTIDIVPLSDGCGLTLLHENVLADYGHRTEEGWTGILRKLSERIDPA